MERMDLEKGEKVLLVASPGRFDPLVDIIADGIMSTGAEYLGTVSVTGDQPDPWTTDFVNGMEEMDDGELQEYLASIDIGIMMPGPTPTDRVYRLIQNNLKDSLGRTIHFHWAGAYGITGMALDIDKKIDMFYQTSLLDTDYDGLTKKQIDFETAMRNQKIRVTTPKGTDISFEIGDRPVTKQNGDASKHTTEKGKNLIDREIELPAGAIRVAPIEESVSGVVVFPDGMWNERMVFGPKLTFESGKVVLIEARTGLENIKAEINVAGDAGKSFREFALGFNPTLAIPDEAPWIPYYGYGAGVVRLSLGDNTELGGNVSGGYVRWNFFTDATVFVGDEMWVENGRFLK